MHWQLKKEFYGHKERLNVKSIKSFLGQLYYFIPDTLFEGYYRAVYPVGDYWSVYSRIERPFPDALLAQKPCEKFALHLSGGFDSAVLAKLYDREDADYIHYCGPETPKAKALAAQLQGTLHEISLSSSEFLSAAEEVLPRLSEPYPYHDVVFAYAASKKAKELGHDLIVSGDGGDGVFGGSRPRPYSRKAFVAWKTLDPDNVLGLKTLLPYMHTALYAWSKTALSPDEVNREKRFIKAYCVELGMPQLVVEQQKAPWAGSCGVRDDPAIISYMEEAVQQSDYRWVRDVQLNPAPAVDLLFRQYSLARWLEQNYKPCIEGRERAELLKQIRN